MVVDSRDAYLNSMDPKQFSHFDNFRHFTHAQHTLSGSISASVCETEKIVRYVNGIKTTFKYDLNVWLWGKKWHGRENDIFFYIAAHKIVHKVQRQDIGLNAENKPKDDAGEIVSERAIGPERKSMRRQIFNRIPYKSCKNKSREREKFSIVIGPRRRHSIGVIGTRVHIPKASERINRTIQMDG